MPLRKNKNRIEKIRELANKNDDLLFIVANPLTDEIYLQFNGKESLYKFPVGDDPSQNIIFQVLNKETFHFGIDAFLTGIIKSLGLSEKDNKKITDKASASFLGLIDGFIFNAIEDGKLKGKRVSNKDVEKSNGKK